MGKSDFKWVKVMFHNRLDCFTDSKNLYKTNLKLILNFEGGQIKLTITLILHPSKKINNVVPQGNDFSITSATTSGVTESPIMTKYGIKTKN